MKKFTLVLILAMVQLPILANQQGHFFINVEDDIDVSIVESKFNNWLNLPANTTFEKFRDEMDDLGIRHLSFQQYVNGTIVSNGMVLVHAKGEKVFAVNGDVMDATFEPNNVKKRIAPIDAIKKINKNGATQRDAPVQLIRVTIDGTLQYRYAYEVIADDNSAKYYIDIETGEIIKKISLIYNADVLGTASTMYNGTQAITCYEDDGTYYLFDEARGIYTLDATYNTYKINYQASDATEEIMNAIYACSLVSNSSTTWTSSWDYQLKSIKISSIKQNSIWYVLGEGQADVYIKIVDANDNLIYKSDYKENPTLPITFNIPSGISFSDLPLLVEIWDYDPVGDDDYVDAFILETFGGDMLEVSWQQSVSSLVQGSYTSIASGFQPHLDAHWGMEKTLDFYSQKLNRNSYDNQGSIVYQVVNMPKDEMALAEFPLNAFAVKIDPYPMVYGTGLLSTNTALADYCVGPLVSIDIMAHEFTHCVTEKNGNGGLVYVGEAGALNESFSDIIGIAVKKFATGQNDWLIGSDVVVNASNMRSMKNPNNSYDGRVGVLSSPQPKTYNDNRYWKNPNETDCETCDHGGVHTNSGVQNYWFYLLSESGNGKNDIGNFYSVKGIGIDKAIQIAYRNLIFYLTPEATFEDARNGSIQAAIDLYGNDSQECKSVIDAWYAVGVGEPASDFITISAQMPSDWGNTISAWVWEEDSVGHWATLENDGEWYTYTTTANPLNIVFVNGSDWGGDNNQSVDISVTENTCIQLSDNNTGKRTYTIVDCEPEPHDVVHLPYYEPFTSDIGNFNIVNFDLGGLNYVWQWASANYGMKASAYVSGNNNVTESWLMSPPISLRNISTATLAFEHAVNKGTTNNLKVLITTDPSWETWDELVIPNWPAGTNWTFVPTSVSLNQYAGQIMQLAFVYKSTSSDCPTWEIKNLSVTGNEIIADMPSTPEETNLATKIIKDGHLYILRDGRAYTVQGQEVK